MKASLRACIHTPTLSACIHYSQLKSEISNGGIVYPTYTGPTEIYPSWETQVLDTAYKTVTGTITIYPIPDLPLQEVAVEPSAHTDIEVTASEDYYALGKVTVLEIPYEEIINPHGGKTVIIAR